MVVKVEFVSGISGSGKTSRLLEEYRNALTQFQTQRQFGKTLWLTPSAQSRRQVLQLLTSKNAPVCFAPMVLTFEQLADRILRESHQDVKPVSETQRRQILRTILNRLVKTKRISYYSSIAQTGGFLDLVLSFISSLKRSETWPEDFYKAIETRTKTSKDEELAIIYKEYQEFLLKHRLFDFEGRFWYARDALKIEEVTFLSKMEFVVVDGFTDFTTTQLEILASIFRTAKTILISKTGDDDNIDSEERSELFEKSELAYAAVKKLCASHPNVLLTETHLQRSLLTPALGQLAKSLFANPRCVIQEKNAKGIRVISAGNEASEIKEIANRVKKLLLDGVSTSEIVVCRRSLDQDGAIIRRTFSQAGIPFVCSSEMVLSQTAIVKFIANLLSLERENWPFTKLFSTLRSPYFRPKWSELLDEPMLDFLSKLLRQQKISSGRVAVLKCVQQYELNAEDKQFSNRKVATQAVEVVENLSKLLTPLRKSQSFSGWIENVRNLCTTLQSISKDRHSKEESKIVKQERLSWESFHSLLDSLEQSLAYFEQNIGDKISLSEFLNELNDSISNEHLASAEKGNGAIRILEAEQVRNLDVPYLFFTGLTESSFPRHTRDDCLYSDAEKKKFHELGISLGHQSSRNRDEMLLFYGIVTRARKELTLSYPAIERGGQTLFPSPYLSAVEDLFESDSFEKKEMWRTSLEPVPTLESVSSQEDLRIHAVDAALQGEGGLFQTVFLQPGLKDTSRNILSSVEMLVARFHTEGFTKYEGKISKSDHLSRLQKRFPHAYEFSPTRLESFASCGFKFLFEYVLKLAPLESPDIETDYRLRGSRVHDILNAMHLEFTDPNAWFNSEKDDSIGKRFRELVEKKVGYVPKEFALTKALNHIEAEILQELGEAYRRQLQNYHETFEKIWDDVPQPKYLEITFGNSTQTEGSKSHAPLFFGAGESATSVQGRIDRIDVGQSQGKELFNVIDYKTGKPPRFNLEDIKSGESIQLAVYLLAVKRLSLAGDHLIPFQIAYWGLKGEGFITGFKKKKGIKSDQALEKDLLDALEEILDDLIPKLAERIRNGQFVLDSKNKDCTKYCNFKTVCRIQQLRSVRDNLQKNSPPLLVSSGKEPE